MMPFTKIGQERAPARFTLALLLGGAAWLTPTTPATRFQEPQSQNDHARVRDKDRDQQEARSSQDGPRDFEPVNLPEGTVIPVRMADDVNSNKDKEGTMFTGTVDPSVLIRDTVVIPRGTEAHIQLVDRKKGGHIHGKAKVRLELTSLILNGQRLKVESSTPSKEKGAGSAKGSAVAKKGAKIGSPDNVAAGAAGGEAVAAAGPVIAVFTAAKVEVKAGSRIEFRLEEPFMFEKPPVNGSEAR